MRIEVLNGEDGKAIVRGVDPSNDDQQFNGCTLEPGEKVTITLNEVTDTEGIEFGGTEQIEAEESPA